MVGRDPDEGARFPSPLELFFDLTFVVAVAFVATELHHALSEGHVGQALAGYGMVFFGIWWAWANFSWFASAYDTDDVPYRVLTLVQMSGVLVLAAGIPAAFAHFDFTTAAIGYVIMRLAMAAQWLRAGVEHPAGRAGALRYAAGTTLVQAGWIGWLWLPGVAVWIGFAVLVAAEVVVHTWAELSGRLHAPFHPGHLAHRFGHFTIICLGEVILATATAVRSALATGGSSAGLLITAVAAMLLVFSLWWSYFRHSAADKWAAPLLWGYGHYLIFAALAALGAGLQVAVDTTRHTSHVSPVFAAFTVAIPVAVFLIVVGTLNSYLDRRQPRRLRRTELTLTLAVPVLVLLSALTTHALPLPLTVLIMAVLVTLMLAYYLTAARRVTPR